MAEIDESAVYERLEERAKARDCKLLVRRVGDDGPWEACFVWSLGDMEPQVRMRAEGRTRLTAMDALEEKSEADYLPPGDVLEEEAEADDLPSG